ncbi:MAG: SDR family oxidoreductase, partial [Candidatus Omnitrophota bacterium]
YKMSGDPLFALDGRVVVVTGGYGLLGRRVVQAPLRRRAKVAVFDPAEKPKNLMKLFGPRASGSNLLAAEADVTQKSSVKAAFGRVVRQWGVPDGLINCAALDSPPNSPPEENGPFETYPEETWDRVMEVNVKGVFLACQVIGGAMAKAGRGSVININSTYGLVSPDQRIYDYRTQKDRRFYKPVSYAASKSSLFNLTRYLATYWAPRNVRVNSVTFGGVYDKQDPRFLKEYCRRVPMGRMARAGEYDGAVIFLLSEASSYMTGANLVLDGGWTAW